MSEIIIRRTGLQLHQDIELQKKIILGLDLSVECFIFIFISFLWKTLRLSVHIYGHVAHRLHLARLARDED